MSLNDQPGGTKSFPRLNLLVIRVTRLEAARAFYSALGLSFKNEQHGSGPEHLSALCGSLVFEIYPSKTVATTASAIRLGFIVESLSTVIAAALEAGGELIAPPKITPAGLLAILADPDGNRLELLQAPPT